MTMINETKFPQGYTIGDFYRETYINGNPETRQVFFNNPHLTFELKTGPSQALINHSPDGFSWGYSGSGPAQLSLAILLEVIDEKIALSHYQEFKQLFISKQPMNEPLSILLQDVINFMLLKTSGGKL